MSARSERVTAYNRRELARGTLALLHESANCPWCGHPPFSRVEECPQVSHDSPEATERRRPAPAPAGLDVERLARAIDDTPTLVNWRVDKGDRYDAVKLWAADIAAAYDDAAARPAEDAGA
jgi:hypothetical protein